MKSRTGFCRRSPLGPSQHTHRSGTAAWLPSGGPQDAHGRGLSSSQLMPPILPRQLLSKTSLSVPGTFCHELPCLFPRGRAGESRAQGFPSLLLVPQPEPRMVGVLLPGALLTPLGENFGIGVSGKWCPKLPSTWFPEDGQEEVAGEPRTRSQGHTQATSDGSGSPSRRVCPVDHSPGWVLTGSGVSHFSFETASLRFCLPVSG